MTISRVAAATLSTIRSRTRIECVDPDTWPNGNSRAAAMLRFSDAQYLTAINETLRMLQIKRGLMNPAPDLHSYDLTYSSDPSDLPTQISGTDQIWKVEYRPTSSGSIGVIVDPVSHLEIEDHGATFGTLRPYKYALEALPLSGTPTADYPRLRIRIRPTPVSTGTFRIWYIEAPLIVADANDAIDLFGKWQDLVVLQSARNVMRRDSEMSPQQVEDLAEWWKLWNRASNVQRAPQTIRRRRVGRS